MIGNYPYVIGTLLLIHLHLTSQANFCRRSPSVEKRLKEENPGALKSMSNGDTTDTPVDLACDELTENEKQRVCQEAMRWAVLLEPQITASTRQIRIDSFLEYADSTLAVPRLASTMEPYTCKKIPIHDFGFEKNMFYCPNRVFTVEGTNGDTDEAAGFFISGSASRIDEVFIFQPAGTEGETVVYWASMTSVRELNRAAKRRGIPQAPGLPSSSASPINE